MGSSKFTYSADEECPEFDVEINGEVMFEIASDEADLDSLEELPDFINSLRVVDITNEIERLLVLHLDLPSESGQRLQNWQNLADALGMGWQEIMYLDERARHPISPTSELLRLHQNENLGRVLRIIRDDMHRYDVISSLVPHLLALEERLKLENTATAVVSRCVPCSLSSRSVADSGFSNSRCLTCTQQLSNGAAVALQSTSHFANGDIVQLSLSHSKELRLGSRSGYGSAHANMHSGPSTFSVGSHFCGEQSATAGTSMLNVLPSAEDHGPCILVTYAKELEDEQHQKYVKWLMKNLKQYCKDSQIHSDDMESLTEFQMLDPLGWLDQVFLKARSIVVVVSENYNRNVTTSEARIDQHSRNNAYLFKLMAAEYHQLAARNKRFRPIVFKPENLAHLPLFLKSTIVHIWPKQQDKLISLLTIDLKNEVLAKPEV